MRLIDADKLKAEWEEPDALCGVYTAYHFIACIDAQPTADVVERKKGRWVWLSSTYDRSPCEMRFWCSECHHETIVHTNGTSEPWEKFCPNCGAEMREGEV